MSNIQETINSQLHAVQQDEMGKYETMMSVYESKSFSQKFYDYRKTYNLFSHMKSIQMRDTIFICEKYLFDSSMYSCYIWNNISQVHLLTSDTQDEIQIKFKKSDTPIELSGTERYLRPIIEKWDTSYLRNPPHIHVFNECRVIGYFITRVIIVNNRLSSIDFLVAPLDGDYRTKYYQLTGIKPWWEK